LTSTLKRASQNLDSLDMLPWIVQDSNSTSTSSYECTAFNHSVTPLSKVNPGNTKWISSGGLCPHINRAVMKEQLAIASAFKVNQRVELGTPPWHIFQCNVFDPYRAFGNGKMLLSVERTTSLGFLPSPMISRLYEMASGSKISTVLGQSDGRR
jgi:hypothetical protein